MINSADSQSWTTAMNVTGPQYHSPAMRYDQLAQVVIVQRVNPDTGQVTSQTPSLAMVNHERIAALGGVAPTAARVERVTAGPATAASVRPVEKPASSVETPEAPAVRPPVSLLV
jgi:hypothetical protein